MIVSSGKHIITKSGAHHGEIFGDRIQTAGYGRAEKSDETAARTAEKSKDLREARAAYLASQEITAHAETSYVVASVRNTLDTTDKFYDGEMQFFNRALAMLMPISKAFIDAMLKTPFRAEFEAEFGKQLFTLAEMAQKSQSKKIIPELIAQGTTENNYKKTAAACKTTFRGEECNFYGLLKHMESPDREERREAYLAWAKLYEDASPNSSIKQFDKLIKAPRPHGQETRLPGGYTSLRIWTRHRADYGPKEVEQFRAQVKAVIVPAVAKIREEQAKRLGGKAQVLRRNLHLSGRQRGSRRRRSGAGRGCAAHEPRNLAGNGRILRLPL